ISKVSAPRVESPTFVYRKISCLPVKVASIECGAVSISHMPCAEHVAVQKCSCLFDDGAASALCQSLKDVTVNPPAKVNHPIF
ncbi:hypothetical protein M404DRAFT_128040, partial [Pisolithus tinctorius Marx 270]